jgi:hypothetical protein
MRSNGTSTLVRWSLAALAAAALACSSSDGTPVDAQTETDEAPADVADAETATDEAVTPADVEVEAEAGVDVEPEAEVEDPGADDTAEAVDGIPLPDVQWSSLPRLPQGKTFTTRYAAGVSRKLVTPDHDIYLGGFGFCIGAGDQCRMSMGVHDDISATAVAIADTQTGEVLIFVGIDSIGLFRYDNDRMHEMVQKKLYEDFGVWFEGTRLMVNSTHSHAAPDTTGLWGPGLGAGRDEPYCQYLRDQVVAAAAEAFGELADVKLSWGKGWSKNYAEDTLGQDQDLFIIDGKTPGGDRVFTLTRWPSHPTAYGGDNQGISADWVGTFRVKMEKDLGGMAVFLQGPIGSVYPERPVECGLTEEVFPDGFKTPATTGVNAHDALSPQDYMKVTCTGYLVAQHAQDAMAAMKPVAETGITFKHTEFWFHPDNELLMMLADMGPLPYETVDVNDPSAMIDSMFSVAVIGDLTFLTTPGESFPTFSNRAKVILADAGYPEPIVTLGLTQDWMGYLLPTELWQNSDFSYHQSLSPGVAVEERFNETLKALIKK